MQISPEQKAIESDLATLRETTKAFACIVDHPDGSRVATFHFMNTSGYALDETEITYTFD